MKSQNKFIITEEGNTKFILSNRAVKTIHKGSCKNPEVMIKILDLVEQLSNFERDQISELIFYLTE